MQERSFDVVVIGAGPGGYVAAIRAGQLGLRVAVVEREHLGGICLNWGCIPAKTLLRSAEVLTLMHRAREFGLAADNVRHDLAAVVERSRRVAGDLAGGVRQLLRRTGVTVIAGEANIPERGIVSVRGAGGGQETRYRARDVVLATGARARELTVCPSDGERIWTYRHALVPDATPRHLLVVGSGAIGMEFASFYRALGADVSIVEIEDRILPGEDAEISAHARKAFEERGMRIHTEAALAAVERDGEELSARVQVAGEERALDVDRVIVAVGIEGNVEDLGLEALGVTVERGHVAVDRHCRTAVPGVWAIGDVAGPPWLAHKASHEGVMVAEQIAGRTAHPFDPADVPRCTYSDPQIASVGLTEAEATAAGHAVRVGRAPFRANGRALAQGVPDGVIKTLFDEATGELLGAHMIGADVTELIQGYAVGRSLETTEAELVSTIFPHPTLSESMHESVLGAFGRSINA